MIDHFGKSCEIIGQYCLALIVNSFLCYFNYLLINSPHFKATNNERKNTCSSNNTCLI